MQRSEPNSTVWRYVASVALVGVTLALAWVLHRWLDVPDPEMLFLLAVMIAAAVLGRRPALLSAALGVACYDFFFVPPYFTFQVHDRRYVLTFAMMFGVGIFVSELVSRVRRQQREAVDRERTTLRLFELSRALVTADTPDEIARLATTKAAAAFGATALVFDAGTPLRLLAATPTLEPTSAVQAFVRARMDGAPPSAQEGECLPLRTGTSLVGALVLLPNLAHVEQRALFEVFGRLVATALSRVKLEQDARAAALLAQTEAMRATLLSSVSHDLRTPLAVMTGSATALRDEVLPAETRDELVRSICEEAERMERLVTNLLDMTRLEGGLQPKREWVPLGEMVGSALHRLEARLAAFPIEVSLADDLPLLWVDPVLFEQLLINVLENIPKYTPVGTRVAISARVEAQRLRLFITDTGPGLKVDDVGRVFEKFYRGQGVTSGGAGLGLAIVRGIAQAHEATVAFSNRAEGGAQFELSLPLHDAPTVEAS